MRWSRSLIASKRDQYSWLSKHELYGGKHVEIKLLTREEYEALSPKEKGRYRRQFAHRIPTKSLRKILEAEPAKSEPTPAEMAEMLYDALEEGMCTIQDLRGYGYEEDVLDALESMLLNKEKTEVKRSSLSGYFKDSPSESLANSGESPEP